MLNRLESLTQRVGGSNELVESLVAGTQATAGYLLQFSRH